MPPEERKAGKAKAEAEALPKSKKKRQRTNQNIDLVRSILDSIPEDLSSLKDDFTEWKTQHKGQPSRFKIYQWIFGRLDAISSSRVEDEEEAFLKAKLDDVYEEYEDSAERFLAKIDVEKNTESQTGDSKQLDMARGSLREALKFGMDEFLKGYSERASDADADRRAKADNLLARVKAACEGKRTKILIVNETDLEPMMKVFENLKAIWVLFDCDILDGTTRDWETQEKLTDSWTRDRKNLAQNISRFLAGNNLSSEERAKYQEWLERCSKLTPQEDSVVKGCRRLKRDKSDPDEQYKEAREKILRDAKGADETRKKAVAAVRKDWKPILDALGAQPGHNEVIVSGAGVADDFVKAEEESWDHVLKKGYSGDLNIDLDGLAAEFHDDPESSK